MKHETKNALDILLSEINETNDMQFLFEKLVHDGGDDVEKAIVLLSNISQA